MKWVHVMMHAFKCRGLQEEAKNGNFFEWNSEKWPKKIFQSWENLRVRERS